MDASGVIDAVRSQLAVEDWDGATIQIVEEGVREEGGWWHVPVFPDREFERRYRYYEQLTVVEDAVKQAYGVEVLLVPCAAPVPAN